jgi:hypothetical protein
MAYGVLSISDKWIADMETGDLSQWRLGNNSSGIEEDSGTCLRPYKGVSDNQAHSGRYSILMTIDSSTDAGCREFREPEPSSGNPLYYSAWYYIPNQVRVGSFWNIMQFKANLNGTSGLFWKIDVRNDSNGRMFATLIWKGTIAGPYAGDGIKVRKYTQNTAPLPVGKWFKLEAYLKQSEQFDGQITVWQDGVTIFNIQNVRTKFPGGYQNFSVNNYGGRLLPNPTTLYIDDVSISNSRITP